MTIARYDARTASIDVYVYKEGALSALAHDLKLAAREFSLDIDWKKLSVHLTLSARRLELVNAMHGDSEDATAIPASKRSEVERTLHRTILEVERFPTIEFTASKVTSGEVTGSLTLRGHTREVRGKRSPGELVTFRLDQRDFGIVPFTALFGTMKVKPEVDVRARIHEAHHP